MRLVPVGNVADVAAGGGSDEGMGFAYVSGAVWVKDRIGTGYWFRNRHELLLVGTRGNVPAPAMGTQWDSVIAAAAGDHSAKPDAVLKMIEAYFPSVPKIELNCRGVPRPGWDAWGNEAAKESEFRYVRHAVAPVRLQMGTPVERDVGMLGTPPGHEFFIPSLPPRDLQSRH